MPGRPSSLSHKEDSNSVRTSFRTAERATRPLAERVSRKASGRCQLDIALLTLPSCRKEQVSHGEMHFHDCSPVGSPS